MLASQSQSRNYNPENITQNFDDILNNLAKQKQEEGNSHNEIDNDYVKDEFEHQREQQIENSSPQNGERHSKPFPRLEIIMNRKWTDIVYLDGARKSSRLEYSSNH